MPRATDTPKRKGKAKNNLGSFDLSQIEADLMAVEAETLDLDPQAIRNTQLTEKQAIENIEPNSVISPIYKPHPVNVVNFNPDNSKLLHKVLRSEQKPKIEAKQPPRKAFGAQVKPDGLTSPALKTTQSLKVKTTRPTNSPSVGGMDGFKKVNQISTPKTTIHEQEEANSPVVAEAIVRPVINTSNIALSGMNRANQFNRFVLEQHKTSLQNQIEKKSLFEKSLDRNVEILDKGLQTNGGKKVYNVRRRKSMLGGVDQYNLGPGKIRRALGNRPMKLLLPVFAVFIVGAYVMYLNIPTISIKVAENKSGVAISEPSYTPDGYRLSNSIEAETGKVAMSFEKSDDEAYNVSQKVSDWDSKALLENKILKETKEYSAYTDRGLTIYVYDGKATWVNQGKVYEIQLDGSNLDVEEMVRIAGSM